MPNQKHFVAVKALNLMLKFFNTCLWNKKINNPYFALQCGLRGKNFACFYSSAQGTGQHQFDAINFGGMALRHLFDLASPSSCQLSVAIWQAKFGVPMTQQYKLHV